MKPKLKLMLCFIAATMIVFSGCKKEAQPSNLKHESVSSEAGIAEKISNRETGATQISGVGFYTTAEECFSPLGEGASYIIKLTGDLEGCLYAFIDDYDCSPSGTYREEGRELFIGTYKGETGSFWTTYKFEAKFEGCAVGGAPLGTEIFGRCQHPIVKDSGEGVFEGVTGRLDFKDDIEAGNFPYRGHLNF